MKKLLDLFKYLKEFGIKVTILHYLPWHFRQGSMISRRLFAWKHQVIDKFLYDENRDIIEKYKNEKHTGLNIAKDCPIWILWWQGYDNAPEIVKMCIDSVIRNKGNHEVILLDENNLKEYVQIDEMVYQKKNKGIIGMALFSDIIRLSLLSAYGGIWCDATLFLTRPFDESIYESQFYGIHSVGMKSALTHCTEGKWSTFFIGSPQGGEIVSFVKEVIMRYWKNHDILIDYFLADYAIRLGYLHIERVRKMIDSIPDNNAQCADLLPLLGKKYDEEMWKKVSKNTYCFKLSWKKQDLRDIYSDKSFYEKLINFKQGR